MDIADIEGLGSYIGVIESPMVTQARLFKVNWIVSIDDGFLVRWLFCHLHLLMSGPVDTLREKSKSLKGETQVFKYADIDWSTWVIGQHPLLHDSELWRILRERSPTVNSSVIGGGHRLGRQPIEGYGDFDRHRSNAAVGHQRMPWRWTLKLPGRAVDRKRAIGIVQIFVGKNARVS